LKDSRFLRLLMVALLATWSPGSWWCCCSAHAEAPEPDVVASSCCQAPDVTAPPAVADGDDCCPLDADEAPTCGCLHGTADAALAAVTCAAPGHAAAGSVDMLAELPALATAPAVGRHVSTCRGSPRHLPARTLLSLGCLLTT
jgi:hypothetical protein